jgi:hypothetical protein
MVPGNLNNKKMSQPLTYDSGLTYDSPGLVWDGQSISQNTVMPTDNRISAVLAPADKTAILDAIEVIRTKLPFLVNLSATERRQLPKMSDKTIAFDEKCASYMAAQPDLVPSYVNVAELTKDRALRVALMDILQQLKQLVEGLDDTTMLAASEAYTADLSFYQNVRQAAQRGVIGADTIYNDLKQRFPGRAGNGSSTPAPTPPTP